MPTRPAPTSNIVPGSGTWAAQLEVVHLQGLVDRRGDADANMASNDVVPGFVVKSNAAPVTMPVNEITNGDAKSPVPVVKLPM
jgi:hypothetical protein